MTAILFWLGFGVWAGIIAWCVYATKDKGETGAVTAGNCWGGEGMSMFTEFRSTAILSECNRYRYRLEREVAESGRVFAYFGINPSTADATIDDQTVKKWKGFTVRNGGARFLVGNVFAYRATNVADLKTASDPHGPDNLRHILAIIDEAEVLVPCWGNSTKVPRSLRHCIGVLENQLFDSGKPVLCFGHTLSGDPVHPQMLGYDTPLVPYRTTSDQEAGGK